MYSRSKIMVYWKHLKSILFRHVCKEEKENLSLFGPKMAGFEYPAIFLVIQGKLVSYFILRYYFSSANRHTAKQPDPNNFIWIPSE